MSKEKFDELIHFLRDYANHRLNTQLIDERRCIPPYVVLDFGNIGLLGLQVPKSFGGLGFNTKYFLKICEQLSGIDLGLTLFVALHNILAIRPIQIFGNLALQQEFLPPLASGRILGAFALTEPVAGSNPKGIISTGFPVQPGIWSLSGHKIWSGSASWSNIINIFVKLRDADDKPVGVTGFVVKQGTKGLKMGKEALTMGMRGMVQNAIHLNEVIVSESNLLGKIGKGLDVAQDAMLFGRLAISTACIGGMKRTVQLIKRYTERRKIGPSILLNNAIVSSRLNKIIFSISALNALVYKTAELIDLGVPIPQEIYCACKILGPEMLWDAVDTLVQFLGGRGYIETNIASRLMRDARIFRIFEGPTETLVQYVGMNLRYNYKMIINFMNEIIGAPVIAEQLISDIQKIVGYIDKHYKNLAREQRDQLSANLVGELGAWGILLAVLSKDKSQDDFVYEWAKNEYKLKLNKALSCNIIVSDSTGLNDILRDYTEDIGDIEETLPGADENIDDMLSKQIEEEVI